MSIVRYKNNIIKNNYINIKSLPKQLLSVKSPGNHQNVPAIEKKINPV